MNNKKENSVEIDYLQKEDFHNGFLQLLNELTEVEIEKISFEAFVERLTNGTNKTIVLRNNGTVIATGSLFIEKKFTHNLGLVGHIEDVVVSKDFRGYHLGKRIIDELLKISREQGCYKTVLDCKLDNVPFYEKCAFTQKEVQMVLYNAKI